MAGKHSKNRNDNKIDQRISRSKLRKQNKKKNMITTLILLLCFSLLIYSSIKIFIWFKDTNDIKNEMNQINEIVKLTECHLWTLEQTKEARFMPSLVQDRVQIGIIFNGNNCYMKQLLQGDILNPDNISDKNVKGFVNPDYYEKFLKDRKNKDDFFTDRESAILFGIPSNFIEGILVGRKYESDTEMLEKIRTLISDCYICNLEGKVIIGNKKWFDKNRVI